MEKKELVDILYLERQRISDKYKTVGWSIWALVATLITLLWMLLDYYNAFFSPMKDFSWEEVRLLTFCFCALLFSGLLFKIYIDTLKYNISADRFEKKHYIFIPILNLIIAVSLSLFYSFYEIKIHYGRFLNLVLCSYIGVYIAELFYLIKKKKPLLFYSFKIRYILYSILILILVCYNLHDYSRFHVQSIKCALLLSGLLGILYALSLCLFNPLERLLQNIDNLLDNLLTKEDTDVDKINEMFVCAKIGYRYNQLYLSKIEELDALSLKIESHKVTLTESMNDSNNITSDADINDMITRSFTLLRKMFFFIEESRKMINNINKKIDKDLGRLCWTSNSIQDAELLGNIIPKYVTLVDSNIKDLLFLGQKFKKQLDNIKLRLNDSSVSDSSDL